MLSLDREKKWEKELKHHFEAETASHFQKTRSSSPMRLIVLLDVDDTLAMSNQHKDKYDGGYYYHQPLVAALKQAGLTEVYLFSAYKLSSISRTAEREAIGNPSRLKLKEYLAEEGIQVEGVLTPLDIIYNKGIGAYYKQVILPFEEQVLKGGSLLEGPLRETYDKALEEERELIKKASQGNINISDMGPVFSYLKAGLQPDAFLFFDDQPECLRQIEQVNKGEFPLFTFRVRSKDTQGTYQQVLEPFLEYTPRWQTLKKRILSSYQVAATPFVFSKLTKVLESTLPISTLPLAFQAKLASIELQFESFVKNPCLTLSPPHPLSAEALEKAIRKLASEQETGYQLWGYGETPLYLSPEVAHWLLLKEDFPGNSQVSCAENSDKEKIFFKRPNQNALQPLIEAFIFELNQCLGGGCVAPTRLLILQKPDQERVLLQASLGVGEIALEPLLRIPGGIQTLKKSVEKTKLLKALPGFLDGSYFEEWLTKQEPKPDLSLDGQRAYFLKVFLRVFTECQDNWPIDFQELYKRRSKSKDDTIDEGALNQALGEWGPTPWLKVLALITQYPVLLKEGSLTNLSHLPDLFEAMAKIYAKVDAKVNAEAILQHAAKLLDYFSKRNYSQHFLLSLLTGPSDDKGENFRVAIFRDNQGFPTDLQLIAIDVNMAFRQGFICGRPQVKTVIYALRQLLIKPLETGIKTLLSQTSPSTVLLKVFSKVLSLEKYYKQLLERVYPEALAKPGDFDLDLSLGDFFAKRFEKKWQVLVFKLFQPFPSAPTHATLFAKHEPGLSCYYQALAERVEFDPQAIIIALFNLGEDRQYDIEMLLPFKAKKEAHLFSPIPDASFKDSLEGLLQIHLDSLTKPEVLSLEVMMQLDILPQSALSLSADTFTALFAGYGERFIAWLNYLCSKVTISISVGEELIASLSEPTSWPWTKVLPLKDPWLVQGLSMLGFEVNKKREAGHHTPLQEAVFLNLPQMLLPLIESGADKNVLLEDKTLLFFALERQSRDLREPYEQMLETLVALNVPYYSEDFALGLECAREFARSRKFGYQAALFLNNSDLAWAFSLQAISQPEQPEENPIILQGLGSHCYLRPAIYQQIAEKGILLKTNEYGRHRVTSIPVLLSQCQLGIHFKEKPEFIGREIQVHTLSQILFPDQSLIPQTAVLKFTENKSSFPWNREERGYPVLATATVFSGLTLQDVLDDSQELEKIDVVSFSQALLFTLLINPEDGRGDNYLLCPQYHKTGYQYKLVPIDHERSWVRPLELNSDGSSVPGPKGLNVKSILYCLDQMQEPLSAKVVKAFLEHQPFETLQKWLKTIGEKQEEIDRLFSKERETLKRTKINLQMVFEPSIIAELYEKFKQIQYALREDPYCSGLTLLRQVMPALGYRYQDAFHAFKTPKERFDFLTEGCFAVAALKKEVVLPSGRVRVKTVSKTTSSIRDIVQLTAPALEKKSLMERLWAPEKESSPKVALAHLEKIHQDAFQLEKIQQDVYQGNFGHFLKLPLSNQQAIINGGGRLKPFDFSLMKNARGEVDIERQGQLLVELGRISFTALRIYRCSALREGFFVNSLETVLRGSRETLSALELNNCSALSVSALLTINLYCPRLEKLGLVSLPFSGKVEFKSSCFNALRVLKLENCLEITECRLNTPILERLQLINLNLIEISTRSQSIHTIELRRCKLFPEKALYEIGDSLSKLKKMKFADCPLITNAFYYEKYPAFLSLLLKEGNELVLKKVFIRLDDALQKKFLVTEKLNQTEAFAQTVQRVLGVPLQIQAFFDGALGSSNKQQKLFAAQLLVSSEFKLLRAVPQEVIIQVFDSLFNSLLGLTQDKMLGIKEKQKALMLLGEVASPGFSQLSEAERQNLLKLLLEEAVKEAAAFGKYEDEDPRVAALRALEQVFAEGFPQLSEGWDLWDLCLMSELPQDKTPERGKVYLEKQGDKLKYVVLSLTSDEIIREELDISIQGDLTNEFLNKKKPEILKITSERRHTLPKGELQTWLKFLEVVKDKDFELVRAVSLGIAGQMISQLPKKEQRGVWLDFLRRLLEKGKREDDSWILRPAAQALGKVSSARGFSQQLLEEERQDLWKLLLEETKNKKDAYTSLAALKALGQMIVQGFSQLSEAERQDLWKVLLEEAKDKESWPVRREAALEAIEQVIARRFLQLLERERRDLWKFLVEIAKDKTWGAKAAALKGLEQMIAQGFSQLSEGEQQDLWRFLLEAADNKDRSYSFVRVAALKALGQVIIQGFSRLLGGEQRDLWKLLLEAAKDNYSWPVRVAALEILERVVPQGFSRLSEGERQTLWNVLLEALKKLGSSTVDEVLGFSMAITLGKILANKELIEHLNSATLTQRFIQVLETHPEIREILSQRTDALVESLPSSFFQGYTLYEVEKLLSIFRNHFLQKEIDALDSPYYQNPKNCFLANPLRINQDLSKQLFEITCLLLIQETPWYPKRMILPFIEGPKCWSVLVLDCDYEKLNFDLLLDNPANSNLDEVLSTVKNSLNRLIQSYYGPFRTCSSFTVHNKPFIQSRLIQFADTGPLILQNIEAYLSHLDQPLKQFAEMDSFVTLENDPKDPLFETFPQVQQLVRKGLISRYTSFSGELVQHIEDYLRDSNGFLIQSLQAIRLKHRTLLVDVCDSQLGFRGLFFKYTHLPPSVESLVMDYCGENTNLALPLQEPPEASTGIQRKPSLVSSIASPPSNAPSSSSSLSSSLSSSMPSSSSEADGSKITKFKGAELKARQEVRIIDVSRQGNNCGLFALALGVKLVLKNWPSLKQNARPPVFLESIAEKVLKQETSETATVGKQLRIELGKALGSESYQQRRYDSFVEVCARIFENKSTPPDMHVFWVANKSYIEQLKQGWLLRYEAMKKAYEEQERAYQKLLGGVKPEVIEDLRERLSKLVLQPRPEKEINELIGTHCKMDNAEYSTLITCRALLRAAWLGVKTGTGEQRNHLSDSIEQGWMDKLLEFLKKKGLGQTQALEKDIENLLILSLLEKTQFDSSGKYLKICDKAEVLSMAAGLWVKHHLRDSWGMVYKKYCEMIQIKPEFLTADELGCLANYWKVQLDISFPGNSDKPPYKSYENDDPDLLKVTLCNPSRMHWQVVDLQPPKSAEIVAPLILSSNLPFTKATEPVPLATITPSPLPIALSPSLPLSGTSPVLGTGVEEEPVLSIGVTVHTRGLFEAIKVSDIENVKNSIKKLNLQDQNIQDPDSGKTLAEILLNPAITEKMQKAVNQAIAENLEKEKARSEEGRTFVSLLSQLQLKLQVLGMSTSKETEGESRQEVPIQSLEGEARDKEKQAVGREGTRQIEQVSPVTFSSQVQQVVRQEGMVAVETLSSGVARRKNSRQLEK